MQEFEPSASVIADSINPDNVRLTTLEVRMHLFMHRAFNTHRAFSRNSASNRAIPTEKTMERVEAEPVYPMFWPSERRGMVGGPPVRTEQKYAARQIWDRARGNALDCAETLAEMGVHKSVVNRLLEPFQAVTVIVSATDWRDFFDQRLPPQEHGEPLAQGEIVALASAMKKAMDASSPEKLRVGQWHMPYMDDIELRQMPLAQAMEVSAARCARVSFLTHDGKRDPVADRDLFQRLRTANPPHWSPMEHVATPALPTETPPGNFRGWYQLRHYHQGILR